MKLQLDELEQRMHHLKVLFLKNAHLATTDHAMAVLAAKRDALPRVSKEVGE